MARTPPRATKVVTEGYTTQNPRNIPEGIHTCSIKDVKYYEGDRISRSTLSDADLVECVRRGYIASADLTDDDRKIFTAAGVMILGIAKGGDSDG